MTLRRLVLATALAALAGSAATAADSAVEADSGSAQHPHARQHITGQHITGQHTAEQHVAGRQGAGHHGIFARTQHTHRARLAAARSHARPVPPRARVSERWGAPGGWAAGHHTGMDFAVRPGTPVRSIGGGKVVHAGPYGDYGNAVTVHTDDGRYTLFAHLSRTDVRPGQHVQAGTLLARSGNSGRSTGPHLHFEVRAEPDYGSDIDPAAYLDRRGVRRP